VLAVTPVPRGGTGKCRRGGGATLSAQLLDHGYNSLPRAQAGIVLANLEDGSVKLISGITCPFSPSTPRPQETGEGVGPYKKSLILVLEVSLS